MVAWESCATAFPRAFTALRLEANWLWCMVSKRLAHDGSGAQRSCTGDAVHLLCRALRLAPVCYRQFSFAAHLLDGRRNKLRVMGILLNNDEDEPGSHGHTYLRREFGSVADLAAAMGQFAGIEGLSVQLSLDACCIVVHRSGDELSGGAAEIN